MIKLKDILEEQMDSSKAKAIFKDSVKVLGHSEAIELDRRLQDWLYLSDESDANFFYRNYDKYLAASKLELPEMFKPSTKNGTTLYRGLRMPSDELIELARLAKKTKEKFTKVNIDGYDWYKYKIPVKYTPHLKCQSWTDNIYVASRKFTSDHDIQIVLCTKQDDDFLFNSEYIIQRYGWDEGEIIHFGTQYKTDVHIMVFYKEK